jgi:nucleoside triphosphate diphosphatase
VTGPSDKSAMDKLLNVMTQLRDPENGCPWDAEQTFETIAPYTIEEAYEVADAIKKNDREALKEELGDLLFQIVFYAQMSKENDGYDFNDIADTISEKMVRRHPHVFKKKEPRTSETQTVAWEDQKAQERLHRDDASGALDGVALALPALIRAQKLQKRAARVGFDWTEIGPVIDKIQEEIDEVTEALESPEDQDHIAEEIGDLLFACVNLARHTDVDAEQALMAGNDKFQRRFHTIEQDLRKAGKRIEECSLEELTEHWTTVKSRERS